MSLCFYFYWNFFNDVFVDCEEALGLLKELNGKLDYESSKDLKPALEKIITVLESNLFGALLGKTCLFNSLQIYQNMEIQWCSFDKNLSIFYVFATRL